MRAAVITAYDGVESAKVQEMPAPEPGPGQVRVRVHASAMNNSDLQTTRGGYGRPALPHILGQEGAGVVDAVGEGVTTLHHGQRVVGRLPKSWAEFSVTNADELVPLPDQVAFDVAASLPIAYLTAAVALDSCCNVQPGEWVLVSPGSGGVGAAAIQLARLRGARVIATTSSSEKIQTLRELGAEHVLNWQTDDVAAEVLKITGTGVQVGLDGGGTVTFGQMFNALAPRGRIAVYGYTTGLNLDIPINRFLGKNAQIHGFAVWTHAGYNDAKATLRDVVLPAVADGRIKSIVDEIVPLDQVRVGLQRLADRQVSGKVVIVP